MLDGTGRACPRSAFATAYQDQIGFSFGNTSRDGTYPTLRNQLDAHNSRRIDVLQIENKLRQVFDRVNIVVRWR
ncbi:hypothetical protein SDC9_65453 [bioreactor metagenome]|uniref:Uncharacterized protein n=1 Tax=bioreactor metagenome TaxID=1076179 RepID=A0A644XSB4_9ZZZZ